MTAETVKIKKSSNKDRHHAMRGKSIKWEMLEAGIFLYLKKHQMGKNTLSTFLVLARVLVGLPYLKEQDRCRVPFAPNLQTRKHPIKPPQLQRNQKDGCILHFCL